MRGAAVLLSLAFLLAGCSGDGGGDEADGGAGTGGPSATATSTGPAMPPVPTTDTLHFLAAPEMSPLAPTGSSIRTPVTVTDFGGPGGPNNQAEGATWRHALARAANITQAEIHLWVDILETMHHTPSTPLEEACTWQLTTQVGIGSAPQVTCINEPVGPINPGVKELVFTVVLDGAVPVEAGEAITVTLQRDAFSLSPNNAVDALSGSSEHDSRITLAGLREPLAATASG